MTTGLPGITGMASDGQVIRRDQYIFQQSVIHLCAGKTRPSSTGLSPSFMSDLWGGKWKKNTSGACLLSTCASSYTFSPHIQRHFPRCPAVFETRGHVARRGITLGTMGSSTRRVLSMHSAVWQPGVIQRDVRVAVCKKKPALERGI